MLNQVILIGRIKSIIPVDPILYGGRKMTHVTITITRSYKNETGTYDSDNITVAIEEHLFAAFSSYLTIDNLIAVKGRLETFKSRMSAIKITVVAERLTFLTKDSVEQEKKAKE